MGLAGSIIWGLYSYRSCLHGKTSCWSADKDLVTPDDLWTEPGSHDTYIVQFASAYTMMTSSVGGQSSSALASQATSWLDIDQLSPVAVQILNHSLQEQHGLGEINQAQLGPFGSCNSIWRMEA